MGFLPNALKLYAYRPEIAETLWKLNSNVMRDPTSTLDQLLKRKLAAVACATNGCAYCTASHGAAAKNRGMTPEMFGELMAIVGMANETNSLANGYRVPVDERFEKLF
jgi:AhpD family alkylhydroperoxidase